MALTKSELENKYHKYKGKYHSELAKHMGQSLTVQDTQGGLQTLKYLLTTSFRQGFKCVQKQLDGYVTIEQLNLLTAITENIQDLSLSNLRAIFREHEFDPNQMTQDDMVLCCLNCFGLHIQPEQWRDVKAITQRGGRPDGGNWFGCVEPDLTHEQIENKSAQQKRNICQLHQGYPKNRFKNRQDCVQKVMHEPELCRPPPSLLERAARPIREAVSRQTQNVRNVARQAMYTQRGNPAIGSITFAVQSFLTGIREHHFLIALTIAVGFIYFLVYTGAVEVLNSPVDDWFELRKLEERQRRAQEEQRRQEAEREAAMLERLRRDSRLRREREAERERKYLLRSRMKKLLSRKIQTVLLQLPFIRRCQIAISDKLRRGGIPLSRQVDLMGARVQVIGKGFGTIVGQTPETSTRIARDIVEFDPTPKRERYRKALVLGSTRKKKYSVKMGKTFRLISQRATIRSG